MGTIYDFAKKSKEVECSACGAKKEAALEEDSGFEKKLNVMYGAFGVSYKDKEHLEKDLINKGYTQTNGRWFNRFQKEAYITRLRNATPISVARMVGSGKKSDLDLRDKGWLVTYENEFNPVSFDKLRLTV